VTIGAPSSYSPPGKDGAAQVFADTVHVLFDRAAHVRFCESRGVQFPPRPLNLLGRAPLLNPTPVGIRHSSARSRWYPRLPLPDGCGTRSGRYPAVR
jgi:hypothetical protein